MSSEFRKPSYNAIRCGSPVRIAALHPDPAFARVVVNGSFGSTCEVGARFGRVRLAAETGSGWGGDRASLFSELIYSRAAKFVAGFNVVGSYGRYASWTLAWQQM